MPTRTYTDETIFRVLSDTALRSGRLGEILRRHDVPQRTYYNWVERYGSLDLRTLRLLRRYEADCERLGLETAALRRENELLRRLLGKPWRRLPPGGQPSATRSDRPG